MYLEVLMSVVVLLATVWWFLSERRKRPPGPWGLPILGYLPWLDKEAPYATLTELSRKYGGIYGLYMGNVYTVVLTDCRIIRKVLAKDAFSGRAPLYVTHGIMNGYGLICAQGEIVRDQRKFVSNCLRCFGATKNSPRRDKFQELIRNGAHEFMTMVSKDLKGPSNIFPSLRHCVGNIMNDFIFGCTWSADDENWMWLQSLQEKGTKLIGVSGPLNFLPFLRFCPKYKNAMDYLIGGKIQTHEFYETLIDRQREALDSGLDNQNVIAFFIQEQRKRLSANDPSLEFYSKQQLYHLLADLFGAGLDTTLTTLQWFYLYLAMDSHHQTRLQEELDEVLRGRQPDIEDINSLPFTQAAIAEAQRIRTVVPLGIPHGVLEDTELEGYRIPRGAMVIPLLWALHMSPDNWKEPEKFNPERFLDSEGRFVKPECFMPFQTGKRMCIGDELARMLLFLFAATILQRFRISLSQGEHADMRGHCGITLTPKDHRLVFVEREK